MTKSFLHSYARSFEQQILSIIGDYCGSRALFATTRLKFCIRKDRTIGRIQIWKVCDISGETQMVKLLRTNDWASVHDPTQYAWFFEFWHILTRVRSEVVHYNPAEFDKIDCTLLNLYRQLKPAVTNYSLSV